MSEQRAVNRATQEALRAVNEAVRHDNARLGFKIVRFGRHRDGYLHAQVSVNGQVLYVHRRYGCWFLPGHVGGRAVMREVLSPYNVLLQQAARPFDDADRRERERQAEAAKTARQKQEAKDGKTDGNDAPGGADHGRVDDEAERDAGVPEAGDRGDADEPVRA